MRRIFGESWYEQVVWDLSCGERAMTKDHNFTELYSSDIDEKVEPDFVYDAMELNLDKMPKGLKEAITQRKPVIIFTNTPFGQVGWKIRRMIEQLKTEYNARVIFACITNGFFNGIKEPESWFDNFHYITGFMFESREFPDLDASFPIMFSVWISKN
jgi:hypothetical protein